MVVVLTDLLYKLYVFEWIQQILFVIRNQRPRNSLRTNILNKYLIDFIPFFLIFRLVALSLPSFPFSWVHLRATVDSSVRHLKNIFEQPEATFFNCSLNNSEKFFLACDSKFEMVLGQIIRHILRRHLLWNSSI